MIPDAEEADDPLAEINAYLRERAEEDRLERAVRDRFIGPPDVRGRLLEEVVAGSMYAVFVLAEGTVGAYQIGYVGMGESVAHKLSDDIDQLLRELLSRGKIMRGECIDKDFPEFRVNHGSPPEAAVVSLLIVKGHRLRPRGWVSASIAVPVEPSR